MAPTRQEVKDLFIGGTAASDDTIDFWITWADDVLDEAESFAGSTYATAKRDRLQRLIAAHGLERETTSEQVGDVRVQYEGSVIGPGLKETQYGRAALAIDNLGALDQVGLKEPLIEGYGTTYDASDPSVD